MQDALSTGGQTGYVAFGGDNSDQPVSGDWNIDGQDSVGVYRLNVNESGINAVYLSNDVSGNGEVDLFFTYGVAGNPPSVPADIPVVGRWQQPGCPGGGGQGGGASVCLITTPSPTPTLTPTATPTFTCPWGGTPVFGTNNCQYAFTATQRKQAAEYALNWAGGACPMFCAFNFHPFVTGTPDVDYACSGPDDTDCANFVSQAYFSANLPLHKDWYCDFSAPNAQGTPVSHPLCVRGNQLGFSGWAWAGRDQGLPRYMKERGGYDTFDTGWITQLDSNPHPTNELYSWKTLQEAPTPMPVPANIATLMTHLSAQGFKRGDLMYTYNSSPIFQHTFLIVGWGPYVETWAQLAQINIAASIVPTRPPNSDYVPYVVDHGLHGIYALSTANPPYTNQLIGAKPYYASRWRSKDAPSDDNWISGSRNFVRMPDVFTVPSTDIVIPNPQTTGLKSNLPNTCQTTFILQQ